MTLNLAYIMKDATMQSHQHTPTIYECVTKKVYGVTHSKPLVIVVQADRLQNEMHIELLHLRFG